MVLALPTIVKLSRHYLFCGFGAFSKVWFIAPAHRPQYHFMHISGILA
jgi:hypothetical protein